MKSNLLLKFKSVNANFVRLFSRFTCFFWPVPTAINLDYYRNAKTILTSITGNECNYSCTTRFRQFTRILRTVYFVSYFVEFQFSSAKHTQLVCQFGIGSVYVWRINIMCVLIELWENILRYITTIWDYDLFQLLSYYIY